MLAFANAKINIGLHITEKREDGYHNLETIFYPVKLYDVVEIIDAATTHCVIKGLTVPGAEKDNLCLKAYYMLAEEFDLPPQQICLLKNIPIGAGLGGGSADGAFTLKLLNDKFGLGLTVVDLQRYASRLGADCAFFVENQAALAIGKGDELAPIALDLSAYYKVLVKPPVFISTAAAYAQVKPTKPEVALKDLIHLPVSEWRSSVFNDFEDSVGEVFPEVAELKNSLYLAGATFALMSGSGSVVYALFEKELRLPELEKDNQLYYNV
ncbi:4-diphosphocytidyl-2-C-methyl-D-erythritol kinase [Pedobacter sp. CAN_A7]|uniref:4-(cytidine 5'-diphospho)-2-C-methyl-D-erythritol kinase n=1 Tax=Pedobacter sp. CAN_A7 TaxID=2787722 RepID=UPI0018C9EE17